MLKITNRLNNKWNRIIYWFHDASVRTNIRWLVVLSIWAYDKLIWRLSDDWQLVDGMTLKEYKLRRELELAYHQIQYYANYANDLQWQIIESSEEENLEAETKELLTV